MPNGFRHILSELLSLHELGGQLVYSNAYKIATNHHWCSHVMRSRGKRIRDDSSKVLTPFYFIHTLHQR